MTPNTFLYHYNVEVIFADLDAMGHVNNATYFTYMETARTKFIMELLNLNNPEQLPIIVAEASCTYKSPASWGEKLKIGLGVSRFGTTSFDLSYHIQTEDGRLVATAKTVQVVFDYKNKQSMPIPPEFKTKLSAYQLSTA